MTSSTELEEKNMRRAASTDFAVDEITTDAVKVEATKVSGQISVRIT